MTWWKRLWGSPSVVKHVGGIHSVSLDLFGWREETHDPEMRVWRDSTGDVLSLAIAGSPERAEEAAVRKWARDIAESRDAGLIEANLGSSRLGPAITLIYKRLELPAYIFTGMLLLESEPEPFVWTIVAGEHGTTGIREAVVTAELLQAGKLTIEDYQRSWGQDPYDPAYRRVDKSVLRFMSDDKCYDTQFPDHPLSKVRRLLATVPDHVELDSKSGAASQSS